MVIHGGSGKSDQWVVPHSENPWVQSPCPITLGRIRLPRCVRHTAARTRQTVRQSRHPLKPDGVETADRPCLLQAFRRALAGRTRRAARRAVGWSSATRRCITTNVSVNSSRCMSAFQCSDGSTARARNNPRRRNAWDSRCTSRQFTTHQRDAARAVADEIAPLERNRRRPVISASGPQPSTSRVDRAASVRACTSFGPDAAATTSRAPMRTHCDARPSVRQSRCTADRGRRSEPPYAATGAAPAQRPR